MSAPEVRMVCFDAGGVLVRICRNWSEGCAAAGLPVHPGVDDRSIIARDPDLSDAYQRGEITCDAFFERLSLATGRLYGVDEVRAVHRSWILGEYGGVGDLVDRLHTFDGLKTGLLSNTNASHWSDPRMLGGAPLSVVSRLHHPHASHLLGLVKPDASIYVAFTERTGVRPDEVLFFDDLESNVIAARRAGWRAVLVDHTGDTAGQMRDALRRHGVDV